MYLKILEKVVMSKSKICSEVFPTSHTRRYEFMSAVGGDSQRGGVKSRQE